ncbi:MAG: hypothetical protein SAK29_00450 [Scytonema sp. PMC 1069.18]|nr:hypothetical protein [Scytonema sp. PMC 1069.18]MEC4882588.1 hypothetical protein [Scytonema sp. PMC 1070.18]
MKESIIRISDPAPKVPIQPEPLEPQSSLDETEEVDLPKELQELESELIDIAEPISISYASTGFSGWKTSDILREIRLDSFDMGCMD